MSQQLIYQGVDKKDILINLVDWKSIQENDKSEVFLEVYNVETAFTSKPSKVIIYFNKETEPTMIKVEDSCRSKNIWLKLDDDNKFRTFKVEKFKLMFHSDGDFHSTDIPMMIFNPEKPYWCYSNRNPIHSYDDTLNLVNELFEVVYGEGFEKAVELFDEDYKKELRYINKIKRVSEELDKLLERTGREDFYALKYKFIDKELDNGYKIKVKFESGNYAVKYIEEVIYV